MMSMNDVDLKQQIVKAIDAFLASTPHVAENKA
jgi:hypothetical protein